MKTIKNVLVHDAFILLAKRCDRTPASLLSALAFSYASAPPENLILVERYVEPAVLERVESELISRVQPRQRHPVQ